MSLQEKIRCIAQESDYCSLWKPLLFSLRNEDDRVALNELFERKEVTFCNDTLGFQVSELIQIRNPATVFTEGELDECVREHLGATDAIEYGTWIYYPWLKHLVHVLPEDEFKELRLDRNRFKITREEQNRLASATLGFAGMSHGQVTAVSLAMEGVGGELRLADFDVLSLSNMNRLRTGTFHLGLNKAYIAARRIYENNPYANLVLFTEGIDESNMVDFLQSNGKIDLLIEECDELDIKLILREKARELGIPVVMATSDRGMVDVERFDLEPERLPFHGLGGGLDARKLHGLRTIDKVPIALKLLGADVLSERALRTLSEINKSVLSWPQPASSVNLSSAILANTIRRILLGELTGSGRYVVDLRELIRDGGGVPLPAQQ